MLPNCRNIAEVKWLYNILEGTHLGWSISNKFLYVDKAGISRISPLSVLALQNKILCRCKSGFETLMISFASSVLLLEWKASDCATFLFLQDTRVKSFRFSSKFNHFLFSKWCQNYRMGAGWKCWIWQGFGSN